MFNNIFTSNKGLEIFYKLHKFHKLPSNWVKNVTIRDKLCEEEIFCDNYRDDHANTWQVKDPICVELDVIHDLELLLSAGLFLENIVSY